MGWPSVFWGLYLFHFHDGQNIILNRKADIESCKGNAVDPVRFALVGGTGVVTQNTHSGGLFVRGQDVFKVIRKHHIQQKLACGVRKAAGGFRVAIAVGNIGFDVENGRAVHQIGATHMQHRSVLLGMLDAQQFHTGKPQVIGRTRKTYTLSK